LSGFAVRNVAKYSAPLFAKPRGALHDHEILRELTRMLRPRPPLVRRAQRAAQDWFSRRLGPDGTLNLMLQTGRYGVENRGRFRLLAALPGFGGMRKLLHAPDRRPHGLSVARLLAEPNGVDLGALEPAFPRRLATSDRRLHLAPPMFVADLARAASALATASPQLMLIGRRHVRSNNSWLHNSHRLVKGKPRCTLYVHPHDAAARGIVDGAIVTLRSRAGAVSLPAEITADVMQGVVCMPHGWGHDRPGVRLRIASDHAGASINDVIDDQRIDALTGTAVLNGTPVEVMPLHADQVSTSPDPTGTSLAHL
jgi:hypothetical protein